MNAPLDIATGALAPGVNHTATGPVFVPEAPLNQVWQEGREKFEALHRRWESRLDALYQAATPPLDAYRYWFGEFDPNASDTARQTARQNGSLKLLAALQDRIQGSELPAEMRDLLAWSEQAEIPSGSGDSQGGRIVSQASQFVAEDPCANAAEESDGAQPERSEA